MKLFRSVIIQLFSFQIQDISSPGSCFLIGLIPGALDQWPSGMSTDMHGVAPCQRPPARPSVGDLLATLSRGGSFPAHERGEEKMSIWMSSRFWRRTESITIAVAVLLFCGATILGFLP